MIVSHLLLIRHKKIQFYIFMFEAWNVAKGRKVQGGRILSQGTVLLFNVYISFLVSLTLPPYLSYLSLPRCSLFLHRSLSFLPSLFSPFPPAWMSPSVQVNIYSFLWVCIGTECLGLRCDSSHVAIATWHCPTTPMAPGVSQRNVPGHLSSLYLTRGSTQWRQYHYLWCFAL